MPEQGTALGYDVDEFIEIDGMVYEQRGEKHLLQIRTGNLTYEYEITSDTIAAGMEGVGTEILEEMDSPLRHTSTSPTSVGKVGDRDE